MISQEAEGIQLCVLSLTELLREVCGPETRQHVSAAQCGVLGDEARLGPCIIKDRQKVRGSGAGPTTRTTESGKDPSPGPHAQPREGAGSQGGGAGISESECTGLLGLPQRSATRWRAPSSSLLLSPGPGGHDSKIKVMEGSGSL